MKTKFLLALLPVVCLSWAAMSIHAQSNSGAGRAPRKDGDKQSMINSQPAGSPAF